MRSRHLPLLPVVAVLTTIFASACGGGSSSSPTSPTTTPTPGSVTGRWTGVAPDGVIFSVPALPDTFCDDADDLQLDLTQVGTALSGTVTLRTRAARTPPNNCRSGDYVAGSMPLSNGTADGPVLSFIYGNANGTNHLAFSGTVSGNRMSGVVICGGDNSQCGRFTAVKE